MIPLNEPFSYWVTTMIVVTISLFWKRNPKQTLATTSNSVQVLLAGKELNAASWKK